MHWNKQVNQYNDFYDSPPDTVDPWTGIWCFSPEHPGIGESEDVEWEQEAEERAKREIIQI